MNRIAFKMKLKAGVLDEYKRRHDNIWPELVDLLKKMDIGDYSIFVDMDGTTLFAVQTQGKSFDEFELRKHPIMGKWWNYMADLMEVEVDNSPKTQTLQQVFYIA